ncbi:MAG: hypothetical protein ABIO05_00130, partial [Ferruginibacter sp.]
SKQLSHFFNSYAQSINKAYNRHGSLFENPFRRITVDKDEYFTALVNYIHRNPQHHRFIDDFRGWEFSSWNVFINNEKTFVNKKVVLDWFGGKERLIDAHFESTSLKEISSFLIE